MKFSFVGLDLTHDIVKDCKRKFEGLLVELGVRKNNEHVGTGLGGNNFQLVCLFGMSHELSSEHNLKIKFVSKDNTMTWGADWLATTSRLEIRKELDRVFETVKEGHKYWALMIESIANSTALRASLKDYQDSFPELTKCLEGQCYKFQGWLGPLSQLLLAFIMCQELAADLDRGDTSKVHTIGAALYDFPAEIILLSVRRYIQIDRLVRFNLDEDPIFWKTLKKVNTRVDDERRN